MTIARLKREHAEMLDALKNIECNLTGRDCFAERVADSLRRAKEAIARVEGPDKPKQPKNGMPGPKALSELFRF